MYDVDLHLSLPSELSPMVILWISGALLLSWVLLAWHLDRPIVPAYHARNVYRTLCVFLALMLALVSIKALRWHDELVMEIQRHR